MKRFLSVLLSCSLLCSSTFAAETNNDKTAAPEKSTQSVSQVTREKALKYSLIPSAGVLGVATLATLGFIYNNYNNSLQDASTPSSTASPSTQHTLTPPPTHRYDPDFTIREIQTTIYDQRDAGLRHIDAAIIYEARANDLANLADRLHKLVTQHKIKCIIPVFQSKRTELEQIRDALIKADIAGDNVPYGRDKIEYLYDINDQMITYTIEAEFAKNEWQEESIKWENEVQKLRTKLGKISLPDDLSGSNILELNRHMPEPKRDTKTGEMVYANGPHTVLNIQQFRQYIANAPGGKVQLLFRGSHFADDSGAEAYRKAFIDQGLLISTGGQTKGWDIYGKEPENRNRKGHSVYFSRNAKEALIYAEDKREDPIRYLTLAALAPDHPADKLNWFAQSIYTGYPDVNSSFVLCSDFYKYELNGPCNLLPWQARNLLADYQSDFQKTVPPSGCSPNDWKKCLSIIRQLQIHLLRAGIIIVKEGNNFTATVNLAEAGRLLAKLNRKSSTMAA